MKPHVSLLDALPLNGYKTYLAGAGLVLYGVGGLLAGKVDANTALELVMEGAAVIGLGHGVKKVEQAGE